jgi:hypothetical protein
MFQDALFLLLGGLLDNLSVCSLIVGLAAIIYYGVLAARSKKLNIPRVGKNPKAFGMAAVKADFLTNGHRLVEEGYAKV